MPVWRRGTRFSSSDWDVVTVPQSNYLVLGPGSPTCRHPPHWHSGVTHDPGGRPAPSGAGAGQRHCGRARSRIGVPGSLAVNGSSPGATRREHPRCFFRHAPFSSTSRPPLFAN